MPDKFLYRFEIELNEEAQWYQVMRECRRCFGQNWRGQPKTRKKFRYTVPPLSEPVRVWFEVPDLQFVTWIGIKTGCPVTTTDNTRVGLDKPNQQ